MKKRLQQEEKLKNEIEELKNKLLIMIENQKELEEWKKKYKEVKEENKKLKLKLDSFQEENNYKEKYDSLKTSFDILLNEYNGAIKSLRATKEKLIEQECWKEKYFALLNEQNPKIFKTNFEKVNILEIIELVVDGKTQDAIKKLIFLFKEMENSSRN